MLHPHFYTPIYYHLGYQLPNGTIKLCRDDDEPNDNTYLYETLSEAIAEQRVAERVTGSRYKIIKVNMEIVDENTYQQPDNQRIITI